MLSYLFASLLPLMLAVRKAQAMFRSFREPTGDADSSVPSAPVNATLTWLVNGKRRWRAAFGCRLGARC